LAGIASEDDAGIGDDMNKKVLCVDDEQNVLDGYRRSLRKHYDLYVASGPEEGLQAIRRHGPFAVIVSDYAMPGMNGVEFLSQAKKIAPDTVRMMLTGYANMDNALAAINEGNIYRFLTKPCCPEALARSLDEGIEQFRLKRMEKELLEQTLMGSIRVMSQILSLVNPVAFSRTSRIKFYMKHIATELGLANVWSYEIAAMLCDLGCITLPPTTLSKVMSGGELDDNEKEIFKAHPVLAGELLNRIPRLGKISGMITGQQLKFSDSGASADILPDDKVKVGAMMLKAAIDFDLLTSQDTPINSAIRIMEGRSGIYHPEILKVLKNIELIEREIDIRSMKILEIQVAMIADEEIKTLGGLLLMARDQEVTKPIMERLRSFSQTVGVIEPVRMRIPL